MSVSSFRKICLFVGLAAAVAAISASANAGPFDCSVAYDEFDSFMNKNYLLKPEAYGPVLTGKISRDQYNSQQKGKLMLRPGREGMGVAIVHTNKNTRGKFLFTWGGRGDAHGTPLLLLRDVTLFGRVADGFAPRLTREIRVSSSQTVDLDTGRASAGPAADIWYRNVDGRMLQIEAVNGARLTFPMATLCKQ
jgi:hypothetical protein